MELLRPWPLTLTGVLLFLVCAWIAMSGMEYDGDSVVGACTTAGWFILGFPFLICFAAVYAAFFALLARKLHVAIGWSCLIATAGLMIFSACNSALPERRLARVIGNEIAQNVTIHRLIERGSFNDGISTYGIISGPDNLLDLLISHHGLKLAPESSLATYRGVFDADSLPDYGKEYFNERLICYLHSDTGQVFFEYHFGGRDPY